MPPPAARDKASGGRIGLALGAGGARGFGHIPVLEAFDEVGVRPAVIAGASIGAIFGGAFAAGLSGRDCREVALRLFANRAELVSRLWRIRPRMREFFTPGIPRGPLDGERVLAEVLPGVIPADFADLAIPLKVVATDFYGWHEAVISRGPVRRAMAASMALPFLFRPVDVDGRAMIDGGASNPLPFDTLTGEADFIIAVDIIGGPTGSPERLPSPTESIFGAAQILMRAVAAEKLRGPRAPDILVRPFIDSFKVLDFLKAPAILKAAEPVKDDVKRALERALAPPAGQRRLAAPG